MEDESPIEKAEARREGRGRRWMVRLLAVVVLIVVGLVTWTSVERRGVNSRLDALRKAGKPVVPADLNSVRLPDGRNVVVELRAAGKLIKRESDEWKAVDDIYSLRLPLSDKESQTLRDAITANAAAFPLVEAATRKEAAGGAGADWGQTFQTPMIDTLLPDLNEQRSLANLLKYDALLAHQQGDDTTAIRRAGELIMLARALDEQPILICHLVACGIAAVACDLIENVAPGLRVGTDGKAASEEQVRDLIRQLLDESAANAGFLRSLEGERVNAVDAMTALAEGRLAPGGAGGGTLTTLRSFGFFKPFVYRNASGAIEHFSLLIDAALQTSDWPGFRDRFAATPTPPQRSPRLYLLTGILMPSMERGVQQQYRTLSERRKAAVALAIALHRAEHNGAFPADLKDLVPGLLPAIPLDPLAGGGKPLRYLNDPTRPRVYDVGDNGVDDGGTPLDPEAPRAAGQATDGVFDLARQPKPEAPKDDSDVPGEI